MDCPDCAQMCNLSYGGMSLAGVDPDRRACLFESRSNGHSRSQCLHKTTEQGEAVPLVVLKKLAWCLSESES